MNANKPLCFFVLLLSGALANAADAKLRTVRPVPTQVTLISQGRPPVVLAPTNAVAQAAAKQLCAALAKRLGVEPRLVARLADAEPGKQTAIALGNMLDNELLTRLYWSHYTYEDARFGGPDGYTVHTVFDPHHWGGGQDVIVLGASRPENLRAAGERFLGLLQGEGAATALPYTLVLYPGKKLSAAERRALLSKPVDPSFTAFRLNAEQYFKTGDETYAQLAIAALDIMAEIYRKNPQRHTPWPEETTSGEIFAAWDKFEACPLIKPEKRREYLEMWVAWSRDLTHCSYEYARINDKFTVTWNHTTFALLGLYFSGRYFDRHYALPEAKEWLRRARLGFSAQARSWKPQEDADSYLVHTMGHVLAFSLADWDLRFFENGLINRYADYVVACGDNRQLPAGFGDSGYGGIPAMASAALPIAFWWTRDPGYQWLLQTTDTRGWTNPFWTDVKPAPPQRLTGLNIFSLDPQIYQDVQTRPSYNESFARADVPLAAAWDKISFRENWDPDGQYLLLDGLGRGKHLHFDVNSITTFVQDRERWLIDHDYLVRNTTEHSMLSVLRDGRCDKLVPSLAGLAASGDLPGVAATRTYVKNYNGVDWDRRVLWSKGQWFLVQDTVTAREAGEYDLDLTWKTIDRGDQHVNENSQFLARRSLTNGAAGALHIDAAQPVRAWVTDHVRQGISVPVSILHQRQSANLKAGATAAFCSLVYATGPKHPTEFRVEPIRPGVFRVKSDKHEAVAGFGPDQTEGWQCDADAWLADDESVSAIAARSIALGASKMAFDSPANFNLKAGEMSLTASKAVRVTAQGRITLNGQAQLELPAGTHAIKVAGAEAISLANISRAVAGSKPPSAALVRANAAKPLWEVTLAKGSPVFRITPSDLAAKGQPALLVACGKAGYAVAPDGKLLWSHATEGVVRDVSTARFVKDGPPTVLVSSADTYLYQLDPAGQPKRKDQMNGIYFNKDHGEQPWGLYCTRGVDTNGDGVDDMMITTLASMEGQGLSPEGKKLWRTLSAYHGCIDLAVMDLDHDGKPEIVIGNKYGSIYILRPDGSKVLSSATSIGDVTFGIGDLKGDGKREIVHGSSTGDLIAVDLANKTLWSFDNYGYPVERIRCADVNGDGKAEVLIASGTGYLYCLQPTGKLLWQKRLGLSVHDFVVADQLVLAGTEDGEVCAVDFTGKVQWTKALGAAVTKLASITADGKPVVVAGLSDGRLVGLPAK